MEKPGQPHILIIDDNEEILSALNIILQRKSYRVSVRTVLNNLQETVNEINPDLIMLDKNLGWADGCELCQQIKADDHLARIPVIMFSAYYKKKAECLSAGADAFIEKPFAIERLLTTISTCLA